MEHRVPEHNWLEERQSVLEVAQKIHDERLVAGTSGNVSLRCGDNTLAITASGTAYESMSVDDIVVIDFSGDPVIGEAMPSTESLMHIAIYQARPSLTAIIHTHSLYASALAVAGEQLPPIIDELVIYIGGAIEISDYAYPSTEDLGQNVVHALGERMAALIRNHGLVTVGASLQSALAACEMVERAAQIYAIARSMGTVTEIPKDSITSEQALFRMRQAMEQQS